MAAPPRSPKHLPVAQSLAQIALGAAKGEGDATSLAPLDRRGRALRDLRVSVTDRCNFRCRYCMPREHFGKDTPYEPRSALLSFEEIYRLAWSLVPLGLRKIRLTGGEPLLRRGLPSLIQMLSNLDVSLALTTNGHLLERSARDLKRAGLDRVTVSLDAVDPAVFSLIADADSSPERVLVGIEAARDAGLDPIKVNAVIRRGLNDDQILPLARRFRGTAYTLRFIEFMDVGQTNCWERASVVTADEIIATISEEFPLERVAGASDSEVAERWRYVDGQGEIGLIASVTRPFCTSCTRLRLTADGQLFTCLFGSRGFDARALLRSGRSDKELAGAVRRLWQAREDRYSELRSTAQREAPRIEMSRIGG